MVGIEGDIYRSQLLSRFKDYSVGPKVPQPVQSAQIIEDINQSAYRSNFPTPDRVRQMERDLTGLGLKLDVTA